MKFNAVCPMGPLLATSLRKYEMPDNIAGRSIVQFVTHLDLHPQEPKSLTCVILHDISKMT